MSLALALLLASAAGPPSRILVLDVAGESLSREEAGALRDRLAAAVARHEGVEVISAEDMRRVLDVEAQKQAAGCAGQSDCLAEIGAALGADGVLYASVARVGERYVVSLSLVDPRAARSVGRDSFEADDLGRILDEIPASADRVLGRPAPAPERGPPVVTITGGVIAGLGALGAAGFGIATFLAADTVSNPSASGADKAAALKQGPLMLTATAVSGGVLALGAVVGVIGLLVE